MALFLTLVYVVTAYLAPVTVLGDLAQYHIQLLIAALTMGACLFSVSESGLGQMVQTYAILAVSILVALSIMFSGWVGGAPLALLEYIPDAFAFFFVLISCKTKRHLQLLVAGLFCFAVYVMYIGGMAQLNSDTLSPYLLVMRNSDNVPFYRLRGLGFLNDPNDLAQFMAGLIPCMFFFWKRKKYIRNLLLVYVPVATLVFGMYLTHSRGGMVALLAASMVASRRKVGILPSVVVGMVVFAGLTVAGFSGGRDVSAETGADRMEAWSTGLQLIRSHPVFGVGYGRFSDYFYITAHNTVIVTAAEIGLVGLFFWMLFILPTVRNAVMAAKSTEPVKRVQEPDEAEAFRAMSGFPQHFALAGPGSLQAPGISAMQAGQLAMPAAVGPEGSLGAPAAEPFAEPPSGQAETAFPHDGGAKEVWSREEIHRMNNLMMISLTGFLTAGWFLSRPYTMTLYVNAGIAAAVYQISRRQDFVARPMSFGRSAKLSALASVAGVLLVYLIIRIEHLVGM